MARVFESAPGGKQPVVTSPLTATVLVLMLSLVTWSFFYLKSMPLTGTETAVVVGFWLAIVFSVRWILVRLGKKRSETKSA